MVGKPFHIVAKAVLISFVKVEHLATSLVACMDIAV